MRATKWLPLFLFLGSVCVAVSGCRPLPQKNTLEELAPVIFWSIDEGTGGKLKISTMVPPLIQEPKKLLTLQVDLLEQGTKGFNLRYDREWKLGQLRILLISESLARKGIGSIINTLMTNPEISQRLFLAVVKGDFDRYVGSQLKEQSQLDYALYRMFKHYERKNQGELTIVNLHQFMKKVYSRYSDPVLPIFQADEADFVYEGSAFFKRDRLVANTDKSKDQMFQLLSNRHVLKLFPIPRYYTTIGQLRSKVRWKLSRDHSELSVTVALRGRIQEYRGARNLYKRSELGALKKEIQSWLEQQTRALLESMQREGVDPLQIGDLTLRPASKPIDREEWLQEWRKMRLNVRIDLNIQPLTKVSGEF
ncbi:spore gernimation protein [Cohnella sp. CBP 2801]|uniref:Spore gernimation protein n=1 Tax=Cohnella zeiphila TaxID=2761120 RepID=A0A7X0VWR2_9BACL|nr:spore gernimation protein [Cohnella zeiphila]